jgi:serine/threonine protein kinase
MGDPGDGWQTVLPTSHSGIERLARPQLEAYERQILKEWELTRGHWSGIGKHTPARDFKDAKKIHDRLIPARRLGSGAYGLVEKVSLSHNHRTVCLARKYIPFKRGRNIQFLREEANVMEKLDHEHIVKLVGSYCIRQNELYLLLWPVAVCNLDNLFDDLDFLRTGQGDREDIISRLEALDLTDVSALERKGPGLQSLAGRSNCPLKYLQQMIGCITRAVAYCHGANIRHLDLKPSNILLSPGRVYLADFGIARDVNDRDHTMTLGQQGSPKWRAPEVCDIRDEWSMKAADVYSLGLILLNVATILYGASMADFDALLEDMSPRPRAERITQYHHKLEALALYSGSTRYQGANLCAEARGQSNLEDVVFSAASSSQSRPS